jgi:hypothetical protein
VAHEFGHALGLQHTMTSSLMSTDVTRATTKATPLSPDDMAGLDAVPDAVVPKFDRLHLRKGVGERE